MNPSQTIGLHQKNTPIDEGITSSFINKLILVCGFLLVAAACMYGYARTFGDDISRSGHSVSNRALNITIGLDRLKVPENGIRFKKQRIDGPAIKLDLYRHWPSLAGYSDELKHEFNSDSETSDIIFLTLESRSMSFDMSGRIETIYKRFFKGVAIRQDFGLVRQPLDSENGYIDEDLYYDADSPYPFAARCVRDNSEIATPFCIRDIHVGKNLMLTYRFHKRFLPQWIELDQALRSHVKSMITNL